MAKEQLKLIHSAEQNFAAQNLDIVHLAYDKMVLSSRPYSQPYSHTLTTGESYTDTVSIPDGEIWVLAKIIHRDIEPGIFNLQLRLDDITIFPDTLLETSYFLLPFAKAFMAIKNFKTIVTNNDTVSKTYRHLRLWHIYDKIAVNKFLSNIGVVAIK